MTSQPQSEHDPGYPGEHEPLPLRVGGAPVSDDEALGVARRWSQQSAEVRGTQHELPEELPTPEERKPTSFRVGLRTLWLARAKAEMEGRTVTDVVNEHLEAYVRASPGSKVNLAKPRPRR